MKLLTRVAKICRMYQKCLFSQIYYHQLIIYISQIRRHIIEYNNNYYFLY